MARTTIMSKNEDWIEKYMAFTDDTEPSRLYRLFCGLFGISVALERKVWLEWHKNIYPNVYVFLVGPPGSRKNTAIDIIEGMLWEIDVKLAPYSSRRALSKFMEDARRDIQYNGRTITHSSVGIIAKELVVLLGQNPADILEHLVHWYDCDDTYVYNTYSQGCDEIRGVYVSIIGGITPELIHTRIAKSLPGLGLFSRVLFVYADGREKSVPIPIVDPDLRMELVRDLGRINKMTGKFTMTDEFLDHYVKWYDELDLFDEFEGTVLSAYKERRQMHVLKFAMLSSASRGNTGVLEEYDLNRALEWLEQAEEFMLEPFKAFGRNELATIALEVMRVVNKNREGVDLAKLFERFYRDVNKDEFLSIMESLRQQGKLRINAKGGRLYITGAKQ